MPDFRYGLERIPELIYDGRVEPTCPKCHITVRNTDYFCFNCGANLKPAPLPTTLEAQLSLYVKSALLPPLGIIWAYPYLRQKDGKSVMTGAIAILITLVLCVIAVNFTIRTINTINGQVNSQLQLIEGF